MTNKRDPRELIHADPDADQDTYTLGVRDVLEGDGKLGEFDEVEQEPWFRRDPEESKHNEAGQHVVTQGDLEFQELSHLQGNGGRDSGVSSRHGPGGRRSV